MSTHILVALDSRRVHLVEDEDLRASSIVTGASAAVPDDEFCHMMEVETGLLWAVQRDQIASFVMEDDAIHGVLQASGTSGLRETIPLATRKPALPLSGNLVDPTWLSINLGGKCDSHCSFCYTELIRRQAGILHDDVLKILAVGRDAGASSVVFTGGEPTLRDDLPDLLQAARDHGYRDVGIQTNGHRASDPAYLGLLLRAGLQNVLLSIHGPEANVHDEVTRLPGSFARAKAALQNLSDSETPTTVNFVACRTNGHRAADMIELVSQIHPKAQLRFSFLIIEGAAYDNLTTMVPTIPQFIDWVGPAVLLAKEKNLRTDVANVPLCVSAALGVVEQYAVSQRRSLMLASPFYRSSFRRGEFDVKLAACDGCERSSACGGLQMAYLAHTPDAARHIMNARQKKSRLEPTPC